MTRVQFALNMVLKVKTWELEMIRAKTTTVHRFTATDLVMLLTLAQRHLTIAGATVTPRDFRELKRYNPTVADRFNLESFRKLAKRGYLKCVSADEVMLSKKEYTLTELGIKFINMILT